MRPGRRRWRPPASAHAGSLILTSAGMAHSAEVIRAARELNPKIRVLARAAYLRDLAGAAGRPAPTRVYSGEGEVALAFVEDILERARRHARTDRSQSGDRAHRELFERPDDAARG